MKPNFLSVVYISHPFGNDPKNIEKVQEVVKKMVHRYPDCMFISPLNAFSMLYEEISYQKGLDMCLWLLDRCDEMWVFGDYKNSRGCTEEIKFCEEHLIPFKIMDK